MWSHRAQLKIKKNVILNFSPFQNVAPYVVNGQNKNMLLQQRGIKHFQTHIDVRSFLKIIHMVLGVFQALPVINLIPGVKKPHKVRIHNFKNEKNIFFKTYVPENKNRYGVIFLFYVLIFPNKKKKRRAHTFWLSDVHPNESREKKKKLHLELWSHLLGWKQPSAEQ